MTKPTTRKKAVVKAVSVYTLIALGISVISMGRTGCAIQAAYKAFIQCILNDE